MLIKIIDQDAANYGLLIKLSGDQSNFTQYLLTIKEIRSKFNAVA